MYAPSRVEIRSNTVLWPLLDALRDLFQTECTAATTARLGEAVHEEVVANRRDDMGLTKMEVIVPFGGGRDLIWLERINFVGLTEGELRTLLGGAFKSQSISRH